ncbi:aldehyde dehydrogenase (NADP(+)) [Acidisoma cladoniae]|jgi:alpha-ketoglutaric semialdehyde dehydrogenase|uniref:aldehyde dehydrogenase (NADP(+)) n=1 Tax=Acidisoma cladoniae TaxID=3040935 RepID=UPI00254BDE01|nr:aldehyde dehydrogenase (NADP(+)) [Acidisoma sp. PAMC 29798]
MDIRGEMLIGGRAVPGPEQGFEGYDAATGAVLAPRFGGAGKDEVEEACALAHEAFPTYRATSPEARAKFLETVAEKIAALGDALTDRACAETGLPRPRIEGERGRTVGQLRLFAAELRDGGWQEARIDPAMPDRAPLPRPDLRLRNVPLGPVAVFGASNFPLAFSVAGGDTASALAAGCPVVVKGHPAHPGTSEMVGRAIQAAVAECDLPEGVFSLLFGVGDWLGGALVRDARIKAVGFTGSRAGGLALAAIAAARREPIPVYAEMSSINPVILLPGALAANGAALGKAFIGSLTMGAGQFCTNPGLLLASPGAGLDAFVGAAGGAIQEAAAGVMLHKGILAAYEKGVSHLEQTPGVEPLGAGKTAEGRAGAVFFGTDAKTFTKTPHLSEEVFGSAGLLVKYSDFDGLLSLLDSLEGQLTITVHMTDEDKSLLSELLPVLEEKAGRILINGWPTGVEVAHAMVHGGPFPATSDSRTTSVGTLAIRRFLRPVCYQNVPEGLLPDALRDSNPQGLWRRIDGKMVAPK